MSSATVIDKPRAGDIIRYRYLWAKEAADGFDAKYARPCVIVHAKPVDGRFEVLVVPLTHEPQHDSKFMKLPASVREASGLGDKDSYLVYNEANVFLWPSWDVVPVKSRDLSQVVRGSLTHGFYTGVRAEFDKLRETNKVTIVDREQMAKEAVDDYRRRRNERADEER